MAASDNPDAPYGLRPVRHMMGGDPFHCREYPLASDTTIHTGDGVRFTNGGIILATAGQRFIGVFRGCRYKKSNGEYVYAPYWASGENGGASGRFAYVIDDPYVVYSIQIDDDTTPFPTDFSAIGQNVDLLAHVAGSNLTGWAVAQGDASSLATDSLQLRVVGYVDLPQNDPGGNEQVEVLINEHAYMATGNTGLT